MRLLWAFLVRMRSPIRLYASSSIRYWMLVFASMWYRKPCELQKGGSSQILASTQRQYWDRNVSRGPCPWKCRTGKLLHFVCRVLVWLRRWVCQKWFMRSKVDNYYKAVAWKADSRWVPSSCSMTSRVFYGKLSMLCNISSQGLFYTFRRKFLYAKYAANWQWEVELAIGKEKADPHP